jgi:hypothetical protein
MKRLRNRQLRLSRVLLVVVGLILLAASVAGLLLATGKVDQWSDALDAGRPLLNAHGDRFLADHRSLLQGIGVALALLAIVVGIWWLRHQIPPVRHQHDNEFANTDADHAGSNVVQGGALAHAFEADLERARSVTRARAEFHPDEQRIRLRLDVDDDASIRDVLDSVVAPAVDRVTTVGELGARPTVDTDIRLVSGPSRHVA